MIKLLEESRDKKSVKLYYDDCTISTEGIYAVVIDFTKPYVGRLTIDATTNPTVTVFLADEFLVPIDTSAFFLIGKDEWKDGLYEFVTYVLYMNQNNIAAVAGSNEIIATNILNEFEGTDLIWINGKEYTIDRTLSTLSLLVLTEPLDADADSYKVIGKKIPNGFFALTRCIEIQMVNKINALTNCAKCKEEARQLSLDLMYLQGLGNNVDCQDKEGAETIFNNLVAKYNDDKCC